MKKQTILNRVIIAIIALGVIWFLVDWIGAAMHQSTGTAYPTGQTSISLVLPVNTLGTLQLTATKLTPSYTVQYESPADLMTLDRNDPKQVLNALWSTPNRDEKTYLSLLDLNAKTYVVQTAKNNPGMLQDSKAGTPFPSASDFSVSFDYYIDGVINGKTYRIFVGSQTVKGQKYPGLSVTLVKDPIVGWQQSLMNGLDPLITQVGGLGWSDIVALASSAGSSAAQK